MNNDLEHQANQTEQSVVNNVEKEESLIEVKTEVLNNIDDDSNSVLVEGSDLITSIEDLSEEEKNNFNNIQEEVKKLQEQTKETVESAANLEKETPEDFRRASEILLKSLEHVEDDAKDGYVFSGESIIEKTSRGQEINVDYLSWKAGDNGLTSETRRQLVLIATDLISNRLVGLRLSDIKEDGLYRKENGDYAFKEKVTGEILTRDRGEGIAPALDNAFLKVITRLANYYKQEYPGNNELNWVVENANLERLKEKKANGLSESDLKKMEDEQARWQSVYGENGKFNFKKIDDNYYSKRIEPDIKEGELCNMESVDMEKFEKIKNTLKI